MNRKFPFFIIIALVLGVFQACNSDDDTLELTTEDYDTTSNTAITAFSLAANDSILANLDSVYFSIDLITAQIFNADSLPCGTDVSRLIVKITAPNASAVEILMPTAAGDTTINYLENATDSIDFSRGGVKVRITATDAETKREYDVKVNVHNITADSLYWNQSAQRPLPTLLQSPAAQKAIEFGSSVICFTSDGGSTISVAKTDDLAGDSWVKSQARLSFTPDINSIASTTDAIYMLDNTGRLYRSTDGLLWNDCGLTWKHIYGGYGSSLIGLRDNNGQYETITYPELTATAAPDGLPVTGTSTTVEFTTKWDSTPQLLLTGGITADGNCTGATWGYDGTRWMQISRRHLPAAQGYAFFPYKAFREGSLTWNVNEYSAWIALGGKKDDGTMQRDVYLSLDGGMHWDKAGSLMQLPDYIPAASSSQAIVAKSTIYARSTKATAWRTYPDRDLPRNFTIAASTRAVAPITEWECPYIYLFGGYDASDNLCPTIWKGVINRLSFKPLQ
ncbi:MAG: hypothetical protein K2L49_05875 [Muribaculaceae bacterium]|nr:hypothetical protein [Muribaculaceae bacterium]